MVDHGQWWLITAIGYWLVLIQALLRGKNHGLWLWFVSLSVLNFQFVQKDDIQLLLRIIFLVDNMNLMRSIVLDNGELMVDTGIQQPFLRRPNKGWGRDSLHTIACQGLDPLSSTFVGFLLVVSLHHGTLPLRSLSQCHPMNKLYTQNRIIMEDPY